MNAISFHFTVQGASHIKKNKECQDASDSYQDENCTIAIVCDGHGGDDYVRSAIGSKMGCGVAIKNIKSFFKGIGKDEFFLSPEKLLKNLEASIINGWNEAITLYHSTHPFTEEELSAVSEKARKKYLGDGKIESAYGTTMIAVAMNEDYWFGIHIGDGKCVAINPEGEFKQPIPWDPKCFLNATTSICDSDAIVRFRHFYSEKLPAAVFVGSDGVDDCFSNNEQLHNLYKTVLFSFATTDFKEASDGLADYLPRLSAKGSGDDVSVAAILDMDIITELSIVKAFDREKEKARVEENARKEAEKNEAEKRRVEEEHARFQQLNNSKAVKSRTSNYPTFCENCGERLRTGVKFCSNCGIPVKFHITSVNPPLKQDRAQVIKLSPFSAEPDAEMVFAQDELTSSHIDGEMDVQLNVSDSVVEQSTVSDVSVAEQQESHSEENSIESNKLKKSHIISENLDTENVMDFGELNKSEDSMDEEDNFGNARNAENEVSGSLDVKDDSIGIKNAEDIDDAVADVSDADLIDTEVYNGENIKQDTDI
ncbi:MAG: protein phosphatase 2C domain-containing protein [Clostridium sp.]|nr:protein phosphatase 2C domain-containing protein [Clostridium sp.]